MGILLTDTGDRKDRDPPGPDPATPLLCLLPTSSLDPHYLIVALGLATTPCLRSCLVSKPDTPLQPSCPHARHYFNCSRYTDLVCPCNNSLYG